MRSQNGTQRTPGPGDLGLRELADEEDRETRAARKRALEDLAADDHMAGGWQDEED